jgi:hypothetical protein
MRQATVYIPRAYQTCSAIVPAWPSWRQKQRWIEGQITQLQSNVEHHRKRAEVYHSINNTYGRWSDELSWQDFNGRKIKQVTCSTCYFKLGFDLAYTSQAYRQAQEALGVPDAQMAQRQMQLAVQHLKRARGVLKDYRAIQSRISFQVRCSNLVALNPNQRIDRIVSRAINPTTLNRNLTEANSLWRQVFDTIRADCVPEGQAPGPGPGPGPGPDPGPDSGSGQEPTGCQRAVGIWRWFNGGTALICPDHRVLGMRKKNKISNAGTWRCLDHRTGRIEIRWTKGGWVDDLRLSQDGKKLKGKNQKGNPVSGTRLGGMPDCRIIR